MAGLAPGIHVLLPASKTWIARRKPGMTTNDLIYPKATHMSVRIVDVCEITKPISSPIRNAYIDFTKMTTSLVAVVTDVVRDGKRVVGYGFNSNGRYGQGGLIRERFAPRLKEADPKSLLDAPAAISIRTRSGRP